LGDSNAIARVEPTHFVCRVGELAEWLRVKEFVKRVIIVELDVACVHFPNTSHAERIFGDPLLSLWGCELRQGQV
jgi:hypothetical protein